MRKFGKIWLNKFDGEEDNKEVLKNDGELNIKFTPEQQTFIDKMVADDKKKLQTALDELKNSQAKANLTVKERTELDKRVEDLQTQLMTKEELAKREREKIITENAAQSKKLELERDEWKVRYTDSTISHSLTEAAIAYKALNPLHISALLRSNTSLTPILDKDGKETGELIPKVKLNYTDADGKNVVLDLTVMEAVKHLSEQKAHFNLFHDDTSGGFGFKQGGAPENIDIRKMAKDPAQYRANRDKIMDKIS